MKQDADVARADLVGRLLAHGRCGSRGGCKEIAQAPHICPFADEINGDDQTLCTCCESCQHDCAMDI